MSDLSVHPVYLSARAAIVAPEKVIPLTVYAAQKWLPRLGPERWCLVMLLRAMSIDTKRRSDGTKRVSCSWRNLAEMLDVHEETIASWMKHEPIPNDKPWRSVIPVDEKAKNLRIFIPRLRYAYETRNGKTRRVGFLLEVLMEDPVVPEDEIRLQKEIELMQIQQGSLGLDTYRLTEELNPTSSELLDLSEDLHKQKSLGLHNVNPPISKSPQQANPKQLGLHNTYVNPDNLVLQTNVKRHNVGSDDYVNQISSTSPTHKSEFSGKNVNELDILIQQLKQKNTRKTLRRDALEPIISLTESLLNDAHSTGMLYKVLGNLYPERVDLYVAAVRVALEAAETDMQVNRGAVFVKALREFADVAGVDLGLKRSENAQPTVGHLSGNRGSQVPEPSNTSISRPSPTEAIWSETQLVLRRQMTQATYDAIIQGTVLLQTHGDSYVVGVQSEMAKEWLENRLQDIVQRALSTVIGEAVKIEFRLINDFR